MTTSPGAAHSPIGAPAKVTRAPQPAPPGGWGRWLYPYGLLLAILLVALWVRVYRIDDAFWTDELYHVIGAQSLLETGSPYVPGYKTGQYLRAYPVTWLTAVGFDWFGNSEAAARIPFLIANMVFLVVAFAVVRRWFDVHLAMIVVLVLSLAPHELILGREVRMYGVFQLLYFSSAAIAFELVEGGTWWPLRPRRVLLAAFLIALLLLSAWIQLLTLNLALALAAYLLVMALATPGGGLLGSRYVRLLVLLIAAGIAVKFLAPGFVQMLVTMARERPPWASAMPAGDFYWWMFLHYYPEFTLCYLLGALMLSRRYGRPGVFVVCGFVPLMIAHVVAFTGRVEERYISYLFPYFVIGVGYLIQVALAPLLRLIAAEWRNGSRAIAVVLCLTFLPVPGVFAHTWLGETRNLLKWGYGPDWKTVAPALRELAAPCVVMSPWPLHMAYYSGEFPDYILRQHQPEDGEGPWGQLGSRTVPVRWLFDPSEFEQIVAKEEVCVIVTDWALNNDAYIDAGMREAIQRLLVQIDHPGDERVLIFRESR
jgi:hypothetical protein